MSSLNTGAVAPFHAYPVRVIFALCALLVSGLANAGPPGISLEEAVRRAVDTAPSVDARRAQFDAAQEESHRAGALPDPMLAVGIDNLPATGDEALDPSADFMTMKKIGIRQEIPSRAKRTARRAVASRAVEEAAAVAEVEQRSVRREAAEAWIDLWTSQRSLEALASQKEQAGLALRLARARLAGGGEVADALGAEAARLEIDTRIASEEAARAAAEASLQRWLGEQEVMTTTQAPDFTRLPHAEAEVLARLDRLPQLLPVAVQVETAAAEVDLARAERRPDWSVAASYGQRSGGRSDMVMLEVGIGLPLFTRNRQDRGVAAREAEYQAVLNLREDLRRQQRAQVRGMFAQWTGLQREVALIETRLLPLARDRSATALAAYRAGGELRPWFEARREELDAQLSHAQTVGKLGRAWAALAFLLPPESQP